VEATRKIVAGVAQRQKGVPSSGGIRMYRRHLIDSAAALLVTAFLLMMDPGQAWASPEPPIWSTITQPDGQVLEAKLFSDEFAYYVVVGGYYVILNQADGYWYYARFDGMVDERFVFAPSHLRPGVDDDSPELAQLERENDDAMRRAAQLSHEGITAVSSRSWAQIKAWR
jgi:hypothetical protein